VRRMVFAYVARVRDVVHGSFFSVVERWRNAPNAYLADLFRALYPDVARSIEEKTCPFCGRRFTARAYLAKHLYNSDCYSEWIRLIERFAETVREARGLLSKSVIRVGGAVYGYKCRVCGKRFAKLSEATVHAVLEHLANRNGGRS